MDKEKIFAAVKIFNERVNAALKGNNAAADIQKAVWAMLKDLGIEGPQFSRKEE